MAAARAPTLKEMAAGIQSNGKANVGDFVANNIITAWSVLSISGKTDDFVALAERNEPKKEETWVGHGTNGVAFVGLIKGECCVDIGGVDGGEVNQKVSVSHAEILGTFQGMPLFKGVDRVRVTFSNGLTFSVEIDELWTKAWFKQLNACKCLQWIKACASSHVAKPRQDSHRGVWPDFRFGGL